MRVRHEPKRKRHRWAWSHRSGDAANVETCQDCAAKRKTGQQYNFVFSVDGGKIWSKVTPICARKAVTAA